jgi:hypothetical protein
MSMYLGFLDFLPLSRSRLSGGEPPSELNGSQARSRTDVPGIPQLSMRGTSDS